MLRKTILISFILLSLCNLFAVFHKIGSYNISGETSSIDISENHAYITNSEHGLVILDITDIDSPVLISSYTTTSVINYVFILEQYAIISVENTGIEIINISNPYNPYYVSNYLLQMNYIKPYADENYVYIPAGDGLLILEISDINNPILIGDYSNGNHFNAVQVIDNIAYLSEYSNGVTIIDVTDPTQPMLLGNLDSTNTSFNISVYEDIAILSVGNLGIQIIDVSDNTNPLLIGEFHTFNFTWDVTILGNFVYMADDHNGIQVVDIEDPANPLLIGNYDTQGRTLDVAVIDTIVLIADEENGLQIVDTSNPILPEFISEYDTWGYPEEVIIENNIAFINDVSSLQILDISNPFNIQSTGEFDILELSSIDYNDSKIYMCCTIGNIIYYKYFYILDVSDPTNPNIIGSYEDSISWFIDVCQNGSHAYVSYRNSYNYKGLIVFNVENPNDIFIRDTINFYAIINDIKEYDNLVYLACSTEGLKIVDVSDPYNINEIGYLNTPGNATNLRVSYPYIYLSDDTAGLHIIDVSNSENPEIISTIHPHSDSRIIAEPLLFQDILVLSDYNWNELIIFNISNPSNPVFIKSLSWNRTTKDMVKIEDYLFTANDQYGVSILDYSGVTPIDDNVKNHGFQNLTNYPNPFNPTTTISFNVKENETAELSIYNIKGQLLLSEEFISGIHNYEWNASEQSSGVYLYRLQSESCEISRKMILLK